MASSRALYLTIAAGVLAVDRLTKWLIATHVSAFDTLKVIPGFFDIVHSQNRGAAFGLFAESSSEWRSFFLIGVSAAALLVVAGMLWNPCRLHRLTALGLALIFGGAMGNVLDRVAWGTVTDFLLFYVGRLQWPAFNVADSAIVIGSGLLLLDMLRPKGAAART